MIRNHAALRVRNTELIDNASALRAGRKCIISIVDVVTAVTVETLLIVVALVAVVTMVTGITLIYNN